MAAFPLFINCLSLPFHRLSLPFHCISLPLLVFSLPVRSRSSSATRPPVRGDSRPLHAASLLRSPAEMLPPASPPIRSGQPSKTLERRAPQQIQSVACRPTTRAARPARPCAECSSAAGQLDGRRVEAGGLGGVAVGVLGIAL